MAMQSKVFNSITYYFEERDDAVAGKLRRLHDWCNVSKNGISGWVQRPQRFANTGDTPNDGVDKDNMCDTTWDHLEEWNPASGIDSDSNPAIELHRLPEMPIAYSRTKR